MLKTLRFMLLGLPSKLQNEILSNYLTDVFTWMSNGHFKLNTSKTSEAQRTSSGSHNKPRLETEASASTTFFPLPITALHSSQQAPHRAPHTTGLSTVLPDYGVACTSGSFALLYFSWASSCSLSSCAKTQTSSKATPHCAHVSRGASS